MSHNSPTTGRVPRRLTLRVGALLAGVLLAAGCGSDDATQEGSGVETRPSVGSTPASSTTSTVTTSTLTTLRPTTTTLAAADYAIDFSGAWDFHLVSEDGWGYDITITSNGGLVEFISDITNSPPGRTELLYETVADVSMVATPTDVGRNAPELQLRGFSSVTELPSAGMEIENIRYSPCGFDITNYSQDLPRRDFRCGFVRDATSGGSVANVAASATGSLGEQDQAAIEALLGELNTPKPAGVLRVGLADSKVTTSYACPIELPPGGGLPVSVDDVCVVSPKGS